MDSPSTVATQLNCTQCGGELHPDEGQMFITCPYCGATVYLDKSRVVFHWYVAPTLNEQQAQAALHRWMSGSQTVKDLDRKAQVTGCTFQYFPLWYFKWQTGGDERITLQPAAATAVSEMSHLRIPAGDLRRYEDALTPQSQPPTVPLEAGLEWLNQSRGQAALGGGSPQNGGSAGLQVLETALVHVPVFLFKYSYRGESYTAVVDAASGTVMANLFPAKAEAPYLLVGGVTALIYLCLATFPLAGAAIDSEAGLALGAAVCSGVGLLAAPILFAWAFWVASKI